MGGSVVSLWYAAAAGCTAWICYTDIRRCWIADAPVLALAVGNGAASYAGLVRPFWPVSLGVAALFLLLYGLWPGSIGSGDIKLALALVPGCPDHGSHFFWPGRARGLVLPFPHREDDHSLRPVPPGRLVAGPGTAPARLARRLAMVRRNGFISLTGLMLALGLLLLYLGLGLTAGQRSRSHQAVDGLAREMALDMQQVRQRCVGNNQSNGRWKLVLEEKRYVLQEGYIRVKERPYPPGLQVTKGDVRFAVDGRPQHTMAVVITSPDGAYTRSIVVAAQTGRIRIA